MSLRKLAAPFLRLAHWCYQSPATRRLMVELRESFDDRATAHSGDHSIVLRGGTRMEHQRAIGFLSKESDTIAWPDELLPGDLFIDIGANIGVYSLYAAVCRGAHVVAFESEAQHFAALNRNLWDAVPAVRVMALPLAISDHEAPIELNLSKQTSGGSQHAVGEPINELGYRFQPKYVQDVMAATLDTTLERLLPGACPRFIKIDVDGTEAKIIAGMSRTLADRRLEQVLIEMPVEYAAAKGVYDALHATGFKHRDAAWVNKGRGNVVFKRMAEGTK